MARIFSVIHGNVSKLSRAGGGLTYPKSSVVNTLGKRQKIYIFLGTVLSTVTQTSFSPVARLRITRLRVNGDVTC